MARRPRDEDFDDDDDRPRGDGGVSHVIPYKNPMALFGYYMGFVAIIPALGVCFGPIAAVMGVIGLVKAKQDPEAKGTLHAIVAICLGLAGLFLCGPGGVALVWLAFSGKK